MAPEAESADHSKAVSATMARPGPQIVIAERYRLDEEIGQGGRAVVFKARDLLLDRDVAVKVFRAQAIDSEQLRVQEAEAHVLAALNHYALTTLFDAGVMHGENGRPQLFLVMELVVGSTLQARSAGPRMPVLEFAFLGMDLMEGLASVHAAGYLHRDIKPANVLIPDGTGLRSRSVKLADFGIASLIGEPDLSEYTTGTAAYLSPEQVEGEDATPASDVYALGLVLLETWTQQVEFPGGIQQSAFARLDRDPRIPEDLPRELATPLAGMTAFRPDARQGLAEATRGFYDFVTDEVVRIRMAAAQDTAVAEGREAARVAVLSEYGLEDSGRDEIFDRIARRAAAVTGSPVAAVVVFGTDGIRFIGLHGDQPDELHYAAALILREERTAGTIEGWSSATTSWPASATNPARSIRAGAGAPVTTDDGYALGRVCVFDIAPRQYEQRHLDLLADVAESVLTELELRRAMHRALFPDR